MAKVFVYGTLKQGRGNNYILGDSEFLGEAVTKDVFGLANVGFPYLTPESRANEEGLPVRQVLGELYEVTSDEVMECLDALEGVAYGHYSREVLDVLFNEEETKTYAYVVGDGTNVSNLPTCSVLDNLLVF